VVLLVVKRVVKRCDTRGERDSKCHALRLTSTSGGGGGGGGGGLGGGETEERMMMMQDD
jgi:hypothetical protein